MDIRYVREIASIHAYQKLQDLWSKNVYHIDMEYPAYYAGSYINDDGLLVILTTENDIENVQKVSSKASENNTVIVQQAEFQYSYLKQVMHELNDYMKNNFDNSPVAFSSFGLFDKLNRIVVDLDICTASQIELFKKYVSNAPCIVFKQAEGSFVNTAVGLSPGRMVYGSGTGSMAYRAKKGSTNGFVISGHVAGGHNVTVKLSSASSSAIVGTVPSSGAYQCWDNVDAAFVAATNSTYPPNNVTRYGDVQLSTNVGVPAVGLGIYYEGYASASAVYCTINSTDSTFTDGTNQFIDMVRATCSISPQPGDSGGIVYSIAHQPIGCVKGKFGNGDLCVCKAGNINYMFGLTMY